MKKTTLFLGAASLGLMSMSAMAQHHAATAAATTASVAGAISYQPVTEETGFDGLGTPASPPAPASVSNPHPWLIPASPTLFAPAGFGADQNTVFGGLGAVNRWPGGSHLDGNAVVGAGFGNADKTVGLSVATLVDSLGVGVSNNHFDENGNVSAQLFRWFTPSTAVALGSANVVGWGAFDHRSQSYYGSITQLMPLIRTQTFMMPLSLTLGLGSGGFVSPATFLAGNDNKASMYGSAALGIFKRVNLIGDYTSGMWSSGFSFQPLSKLPMAVTVYATNLGGSNWVHGPVTYGARLAFGKRFA